MFLIIFSYVAVFLAGIAFLPTVDFVVTLYKGLRGL